MSKDKREFDVELSDDTLELMLFRESVFNKDFIGRLASIVDFRWFRTPHLRLMAQISINYFTKYGALLTRDLVESVLNKKNESIIVESNKIDVTKALYDFNKAKDLDLGKMDDRTRIGKIEKYVKQEAMRNALLDAASDLEKKNTNEIIENCLKKFEDIRKILFEEIDFGFQLDNEKIDDTIETHLDYLTNPASVISTGWDCIDGVTRGGFLRDGRSIYVFMAQAGLGKSNILANLGYNFLKQDLKVLVITMEMSENVYLRRFDSLISKIDIDDLGISSMTSILKEKMLSFFKVEHPNAKLLIKEYPTGSISCRNIENYIDEMYEQKNFKPDVLIVDYLNIIKPNGGSNRGEANLYEDGKVVSEELRALSYKYEIPVVTAVQCNSSGFNTADIGMENIAQSRGIAHTADFIAGLYQTEDEQADGIFHMKILKSRYGDKSNFRFNFNKDTMEFTDINGDIPPPSNDIDSTKSIASGKVSRIDEMDKDLFGEGLGFDNSNDLGMP